MAQFYITTIDPTTDVETCRRSLKDRAPITITAMTPTGEIRVFTGVVQSIEYIHHAVPVGTGA